MILATVKEKLHEYIDHADEKKIQAIYTLVEDEIEDTNYQYDEETLNMLRNTSRDYFSGKIKGYSEEESMERVRKQIGKA
jgi:hypothetical protein